MADRLEMCLHVLLSLLLPLFLFPYFLSSCLPACVGLHDERVPPVACCA